MGIKHCLDSGIDRERQNPPPLCQEFPNMRIALPHGLEIRDGTVDRWNGRIAKTVRDCAMQSEAAPVFASHGWDKGHDRVKANRPRKASKGPHRRTLPSRLVRRDGGLGGSRGKCEFGLGHASMASEIPHDVHVSDYI